MGKQQSSAAIFISCSDNALRCDQTAIFEGSTFSSRSLCELAENQNKDDENVSKPAVAVKLAEFPPPRASETNTDSRKIPDQAFLHSKQSQRKVGGCE